jgi:hypothetical protein
MRRFRSFVCLAVALAIAFSSLLSGCADQPKTSDEISATVDSYFGELQSGSFSKNGYASSYAKGAPFASVVFVDEGIRPCMDLALEQVVYEVTKAEGDTKSGTGTCTILVTFADPEEALEGIEEDWVTAEHLSSAISSEDSKKIVSKVILTMTYDTESGIWMVADSTELANAIGTPYAELNLYSAAGDPRLALKTFLDALTISQYAELEPLLQEDSTYDLLFPENVDIKVRQAFFEQMKFEIQEMTMTDDSCEIEVLFDFVDLQTVSDRLAQSADLLCEMFKFVLTGLLSESEPPTLNKYNSRQVDLSLTEITRPDALRLQETFVFRLEPSADGQQWQIVEFPSFMTKVEYESAPADDMVNQAAVGMALIELFDEGIITQTVLDEQLQKYGIEGVKYSSRKVVESLTGYEFIDLDTLEKVENYSSSETYELAYKLEFDQDWPDLTYNLIVIDDATGDVINRFEVTTDTPFPSIYAGTVGNSGELWAPGSYTLLFLLEDSTVLAYMSIEVK